MAIRAGKQNIPCICVTNRTLCRDDFLTRIDHIAKKGVADAILLREKDLTEREYLELAEFVSRITGGVFCILIIKQQKSLGVKKFICRFPFCRKCGKRERRNGLPRWERRFIR